MDSTPKTTDRHGPSRVTTRATALRAGARLGARFKTSPEIGARTYDLTVTRLRAFSEAGEISAAGFTAVLETMAELGLITSPAPGAARFVDPSYLALAGKGAGG